VARRTGGWPAPRQVPLDVHALPSTASGRNSRVLLSTCVSPACPADRSVTAGQVPVL